jgi:hypothetical protein
MVSVDYYMYSRRIESISTADCIFHSPQSLHLIAMPAPIYLKFLAGALADWQCWQCDWKSPPRSQDSLPIQSRKSCSVDDLVSTVHHAEQGMAGFYRDVTAKIMGACVLNATKMVCYDVSKGYVCNAAGWARKDVRTSFCSATLACYYIGLIQ